MEEYRDLTKLIASIDAGTRIELEVFRSGGTLTIPVTHRAAFRRRLYELGTRVRLLGPQEIRDEVGDVLVGAPGVEEGPGGALEHRPERRIGLGQQFATGAKNTTGYENYGDRLSRVEGIDLLLTGHAARDGYADQLDGPMISLQLAMDLTWRMLGVWLTVLALLLLVGVIV